MLLGEAWKSLAVEDRELYSGKAKVEYLTELVIIWLFAGVGWRAEEALSGLLEEKALLIFRCFKFIPDIVSVVRWLWWWLWFQTCSRSRSKSWSLTPPCLPPPFQSGWEFSSKQDQIITNQTNHQECLQPDHHHHHHHDQECHQPRPDMDILSPFSRRSHQDSHPISRWEKTRF